MSNSVLIKVASNGFIIAVDDNTQIFSTKKSLLTWLNENLPDFQEADAKTIGLKGKVDG
jgi:hypothetical protein